VIGVGSHDRSELEQFAAWFHQDWDVMYPDFYEGARAYLADLSPARRGELREELEEFLGRHRHATPREMLEAWFGLGARAWQPGLDISTTLRDFLQMM
jgi:hypothetical protein